MKKDRNIRLIFVVIGIIGIVIFVKTPFPFDLIGVAMLGAWMGFVS